MTGSQGQDTSDALAAAIRQAVRIHHIGPNSTSVINNGGSVLLTPQEANEAATNMRDWFQRALAAERERVLQEAADDRESHHFPCCEHCGVKQRGYGHAAPCADCQTEAAAIARGNPHTSTEEEA